MSCRRLGYPWSSLTTSPYRSSLLVGLQGHIPYPHIAAECMFELVVLLLPGHMWGSIWVHHLCARPCFSSSGLALCLVCMWKNKSAQFQPSVFPSCNKRSFEWRNKSWGYFLARWTHKNDPADETHLFLYPFTRMLLQARYPYYAGPITFHILCDRDRLIPLYKYLCVY